MAVAFERKKETLDFVRDNWEIMYKKDIAKKLGCSASTVSIIGTELGLPIQGRSKESFYRIDSIKRMKNDFRLGEKITLRVSYGKGRRKIVKGIVTDKTDYLVLVKWKKYGEDRRESFRYDEFCVGEVQVVSRNEKYMTESL
ncbi:hypothetical protein [Clostridium kluyveri]|uniref:Uncharacterized protein n=1 Tax=Clostridium kluyveri TaxID=1534 RepID=A0A1L5F3A7_CLOKL|nr:hypothetical protein [Clostridium kluyveri]APM37340.1 hypothetical protein BS101_00440 [Clostridium kluyveri]